MLDYYFYKDANGVNNLCINVVTIDRYGDEDYSNITISLKDLAEHLKEYLNA